MLPSRRVGSAGGDRLSRDHVTATPSEPGLDRAPHPRGGPLQGVSVVEVAGGVATAWCARLLGQLGADVIVAEPPEGSPLRARPPLLPSGESPWHLWLNADKASAVVDTEAALAQLAHGADVVVHPVTGTEPPGMVEARAEAFRRATPRQVFAALSPFGLTGPWRGLAASELTEWAAGGHLHLTGDAHREPVQGGGPWPAYFTGSTAVIGIMAAAFDAARTGEGQLVDVGAMETMAAAHQWTLTAWTHHGYVKRRDGNRLAESYHPLTIYQCRDGWVQVAAATNEQFEAVCILTDSVELLADDDLMVPAGRYDRADDIDQAVAPWFAEQTTVDAVDALQQVRVPAAVVNDVPGVLADEQLRHRRYWSPVPAAGADARVPGPAFWVGSREPAAPVAAPDLGDGRRWGAAGARASSAGAPGARDEPAIPPLDLSGVRVLEFSVAWAGPLTGRFLADLGADVIKVEHPTSRGLAIVPGGAAPGWAWGDLPPSSVRNGTWPATDPGPRWFNSMGMFNKLQRNKRSLCLDVKAPGGTEVLHRLVAQSDVVLNNYSPRGVASLGIDHDSLAAVNPHIITVSMSGYGATGPMASHFSFGPILETHAGLASTTGYPEGGPLRVGVAFPDPAGGLLGTVATLGALWQRATSGQGLAVDLSQLETLLPLIGDHLLVTSATGVAPLRLGNRSLSFAPQGVYRCGGDDQWLALTVRSDDEWRSLVAIIGSAAPSGSAESVGLASPAYEAVETRRDRHDLIDEYITAWTSQRGKFEAMAALQARGIPADGGSHERGSRRRPAAAGSRVHRHHRIGRRRSATPTRKPPPLLAAFGPARSGAHARPTQHRHRPRSARLRRGGAGPAGGVGNPGHRTAELSHPQMRSPGCGHRCGRSSSNPVWCCR